MLELSVVLEEGAPYLMAGYLFFPGNGAPYQDSQESQADLSQDLEGSGEQEGELVLTEEAIQSQGEQVEASSCQDAFEDKKAMESDPGDLDENFQCPREEDTEEMLGSPGCKTCHYRLVQTPKTFADAQDTCWRCYRGNLAAIHSLRTNNQLQHLASKINQQQVWIGGAIGGWPLTQPIPSLVLVLRVSLAG
ncbi:proteoglycan 3-like [Myotis yumanensis]|uniref:proteoglycan 3-like n=1 Tax=Myotis yumanensis TaxID=159337 RepID=UPI0038D42B99